MDFAVLLQMKLVLLTLHDGKNLHHLVTQIGSSAECDHWKTINIQYLTFPIVYVYDKIWPLDIVWQGRGQGQYYYQLNMTQICFIDSSHPTKLWKSHSPTLTDVLCASFYQPAVKMQNDWVWSHNLSDSFAWGVYMSMLAFSMLDRPSMHLLVFIYYQSF